MAEKPHGDAIWHVAPSGRLRYPAGCGFWRVGAVFGVTAFVVGAGAHSLATVGFDATTTLKRSDFGLGKYVPQVSGEIQLRIISQGVEAKSYAAYLKAQAAAEQAEAAMRPAKAAAPEGSASRSGRW